MTKTANVPMFFLWLNLDFKKDRDLLPKAYMKRLEEEVEARKKAEITAPLCFVYRSSFLLSDKSEQIKAIEDLGIQVFDYDELIKIREYKQSEISSCFTREVMEDVLKCRTDIARNNKADLIDIIKLELLYNYHLFLECNVENGCIIQDFDVALIYKKLAEAIASISDENLEKLFLGPIPDGEGGAPGRNRVENNFTYVSKPKHEALKELIEYCDKLKKKIHWKSLSSELASFYLKIQSKTAPMNILITAVYEKTIVNYKNVLSFTKDVFRFLKSDKTWEDSCRLDELDSVFQSEAGQDPKICQDGVNQAVLDAVDSGEANQDSKICQEGVDQGLDSSNTTVFSYLILLYTVIIAILAVVQVILAIKNGFDILNDKMQAACMSMLVTFVLGIGIILIYEKCNNKQNHNEQDNNEQNHNAQQGIIDVVVSGSLLDANSIRQPTEKLMYR